MDYPWDHKESSTAERLSLHFTWVNFIMYKLYLCLYLKLLLGREPVRCSVLRAGVRVGRGRLAQAGSHTQP